MIRLPKEELDGMSVRRLKIVRSQRIMLLSKTTELRQREEIEAFIQELTERIQSHDSPSSASE